MKKFTLIILAILMGYGLISALQILQEKSLVLNIEVPIRVFDGDEFVDNLTIKDIELFEDGIPQRIEALYLINQDLVKRKEEKKIFAPKTERTFYLFFEVTKYNPKMGEAIDYFIENVLLPNDNLFAVTPLKTYRLKDKGIEIKPRKDIADELKGYLKKDTHIGSIEYTSAVSDIKDVAKAIAGYLSGDSLRLDSGSTQIEIVKDRGVSNLPEMITFYRISLEKLETLRKLDEMKLMEFAEYLKERGGQKYVFMFYQREFVPQIDPKILVPVLSAFQNVEGMDLSQNLIDIEDLRFRAPEIDFKKVQQAYADASTSIHFLFITTPREMIPGVYFAERSTDIFATFAEISKASGGMMDSSANPNYLLNKAIDASENYYLLYYTPKNYRADGKFRRIDVKVKGWKYRILHRAGYIAD
ncbi:MAG: hypothetical protein ABIN18_28155 [Pseudomonadota bacterium]